MWWVGCCALLGWVGRVAVVYRRGRGVHPAGRAPLRTLVVLGSGGHTAEMLAMLGQLDRRQFGPLHYVLATSDSTSERRVEAFERQRVQQLHHASDHASDHHQRKQPPQQPLQQRPQPPLQQRADGTQAAEAPPPPDWRILRVPRSREVGQSYLTSIVSTLYATLYALALVWRQMPSLVLCNGPGTCVPVCLAAYAVRVASPKPYPLHFEHHSTSHHSKHAPAPTPVPSKHSRDVFFFCDQIRISLFDFSFDSCGCWA